MAGMEYQAGLGLWIQKWGYSMTHKEKANQLLNQQYHCSQALFGAFAEDFGMDLKTAFKVSTCFGAGMRQRGMIYPNEFIPIIEENGFIKKVDYYIWEEACRFIRKCKDAGMESCPVSVNVSRVHLRDNECVKVLSDMIEEYQISKGLLELEITETADDQQVSLKALELKEEGFKLLMDDFGSGYSSLNILLETPFDVIKLDKKFMENMMVSGKGRLILEQVVSMANKLELGLLAEGVETKDQIELLQSIGCDQVQGYYYAKPMPEEEFYALLEKQYAK